MGKTRAAYPPEFRRQMVELVRAGRSPEELAREFEPTAQSIRNWLAQSARNAGRGDGGLTTAEREELNRLRRENRQLRLEREILSKAATLDFSLGAFPIGSCAQTNIARTQGIIWRRAAQEFVIYVRSSFAAYLRAWLDDAAQV